MQLSLRAQAGPAVEVSGFKPSNKQQQPYNSDGDVNENSDVVVASEPTSPFDEIFCAASTLCLLTPCWGVHRIDSEGYHDLEFHDTTRLLLCTSDGTCVLFN